MKLGLNVEKPSQGSFWPSIIVASFACFGGILYGYDTGSISGIIAMDHFKHVFATHQDDGGNPFLTSSQKSLIVSILSAGTSIGSFSMSFVGEIFGRRINLIIGCAVFAIGVALQAAASAIPLFAVGRFFAGLGLGFISAVVPLYQSEAAPKWIRGSIVSGYQWAITIGLLIASIVNNSTQNRTNTSAYRIPICIQFAWGLILAVGMAILPESPRYFVKKGKLDEARKSLGRLSALPPDHEYVSEQLLEIRANYEYELSCGSTGFIHCFTNEGRQIYRLVVVTTVQALQQLSGINFIFYYGTDFFQKSGITDPFTINLITNIVNVVMTPPGMYAVERIGRRKLLLVGAIGMCAAEYIVAIVGVSVNSVVSNKVLIAFVCMYIAFFASTWGPVAWVVTGETFSLRTRSKSVALCTMSNWIWNFGIGFATPYMVDSGPGNANLGPKVFFIWGTFCLAAVVFVFLFVFETKGLSLEEVDELYEKVSSARQSSSFVPTHALSEDIKNAENIVDAEKQRGLQVERV
ncbi:general substrate transporter [Lipomyces chichibuensis]|uniref:general substrate transporter n=1 Tax=Lipomyces chichibuensis TaxID=1546026 RepID=UPI0033434CBD